HVPDRALHPFPARRSSDLGKTHAPSALAATDPGSPAGADRPESGIPSTAMRYDTSEVTHGRDAAGAEGARAGEAEGVRGRPGVLDRKSTRLNSSHGSMSYA